MKYKYFTGSLLAATLSFGIAHAKPKPSLTLNAGGSSASGPTYIADFEAYTAAKSGDLFSYEAVGSGGGQNAFLTNNIGYFEPASPSNTIGYKTGTLTYGTIVGTQVDFAASDAYLVASQLTNPATGSYGTTTEGSAIDGPLIQIPTIGIPLTLAFNQSAIGSAGLTLNDAQICGVLSGKITDWHALDSAIPAGTTIDVAYRSDSSGSTFLLTQHLNAVCTSANSNFAIPVAITKTFASLFPGSTPPANFTGENGSGALAQQLVATANSLGYVSPDYTSIAPKSANTTSLQVASVVNGQNNVAYLPTVANTTLGLTHPGPGSTNATPPATLSAAQNPLNWVPAVPQTTEGYSLVGYNTLDASSCYANTSAGKLLVDFLKDVLKKSGSYATVTTNNGFVPLSNSGAAKFFTAVSDTFLSNKSGYNLDIDDATTCASYAGR
jgi:ABC-type phosphate transport system substrate-binding protein